MRYKDKAQQVLDVFDFETGLMSSEIKRCAFILVDHLIKHTHSVNGNPPNLQTIDESCSEFWIEVKKELELL